jgi:hypothetical protein
VERAGTRSVSSDKPPFLLECVGFRTLTRPLYVQIPTANCSIEVEWLTDVRKGRWKWKASYANKCEVTAYSGDRVHVISTALSGTFDHDSDSPFFMMVDAEGNGSALGLCMQFPTDKVLPEVHFKELKEPSGPNHRVTWEFLRGRTTEIQCTNVSKQILWESEDASGQKEYDYENRWRSYFIGIPFGGPDTNSEFALGVAPNGKLSVSKDSASLADFVQVMASYHSSPDTRHAPGPLMKALIHKLVGG